MQAAEETAVNQTRSNHEQYNQNKYKNMSLQYTINHQQNQRTKAFSSDP